MAWRLTPHTTFVANTTVITAAYENAVQQAISDLFNGSHTVRRLHVDGVGDQVTGAVDGQVRAPELLATLNGVTASAGNIVASAGSVGALLSRFGTTTPQTTVTWGHRVKETTPAGWGVFNIIAGPTFNFVGGVNVYAINRLALGDYEVTFDVVPTNVTKCAGFATSRNMTQAVAFDITTSAGTGNRLKLRVRTFDASVNTGALLETEFHLFAFAG